MDSAIHPFLTVDTSQIMPSCCKGSPDSIFHPLSSITPRDRSNLRDDKAVVVEPQEDHVPNTTLLTSDYTRPISETLTTMSHAHLSEYATVATASRYSHTSSSFHLSYPASPSSSEPPTTYNSRVPSPSPEDRRASRYVTYSLKWRLASGYFAYFVLGWADGVTGTVMPYLNAEFEMTTLTSSLLWVGTTCGFFTGTFLVEAILKYLGRCKLSTPKKNPEQSFLKISSRSHLTLQARYLALVIASTMHTFYFIMMGSRGGFPVMFLGYALAAFARALLTAPLNAYLASCSKPALGFAYGLASLGSVASSFVCQFIIATGVPWFHFYYGSLVLSGMNIMLLALVFRPNQVETAQEHGGIHGDRKRPATWDTIKDSADPLVSDLKIETQGSGKSSELLSPPSIPSAPTVLALKIALSMPYQWAFSMFVLLYCGSETTTQGFMVTYLLGTKGANPNTVGYVTSGFWGGISLGRFVWGYCTEFLSFTQRKHVVHAFLGLVLQVLIWVVPSHVQNSVAAGFIGLFYGPVLPAALAMANDILPEEVHMNVMALINAFASLGGAIFPLVAGTVLSVKGISTFAPIAAALTAALAVLWALFPSRIPARITIV